MPGKIVKEDDSLVAWLAGRQKTELSSIKAKDSDFRKYISERCVKRNEWIREEISNGSFLLNSDIDRYVNGILNDIKKGNPQIDTALRVLVMANNVPNAFDLGNGIIVVIAGLMNRLDNEAQLAFILCHEAAHYQLNHVAKSLADRAERFNEKKINKAAKEALKQKYQTKKKFLELVQGDVFNFYSRSRSYELEADSLALQFFGNTNYSLKEAVTAIDMLKHIDEIKDSTLFDLKAIFSTSDYSFRDSWLFHESASSLGVGFTYAVNEFADSLKTHPDCSIRSSVLSSMIGNNSQTSGVLYLQEKEYPEIKRYCSAEIIYNELIEEDLGYAIFLSLFHLKEYPQDKFPVQVISISLAMLSFRKSEFRGGVYLDLPSSEYFDKYNRVLEFLSELKAKDAANIGFWFLRRNTSGVPSTEMELAAYALTASARAYDAEAKSYIGQYKKDFPEGVFKNEFTEIENKNKTK